MTNQATEIAALKEINAVTVFSEGGIDPILKAIEAEVTGEVPDLESDKGRKRIASLAHTIARSKTALDAEGKALADKLNAQLKPINAERKKAREFLDDLKERIRKPLTEWETEQKRIQQEQFSNAEWFKNVVVFFKENEVFTADDLRQKLTEVKDRSIGEECGPYENQAKGWKLDAIEYLENTIIQTEFAEAEAKKAEQLRKEQEEKARLEREEQIKREAEDRARKEEQERQEAARLEAERQKREAEEAAKKAEADRIAAIEKAEREQREAAERAEREKQQAIEAERKRAEEARIAEEQRKAAEQAEIERKARNKAHQKRINNEALECFKSLNMDEAQAKQVIEWIAKGMIKNVTINY